MKKRVLSIAIALTLLFSLLPGVSVSSYAEDHTGYTELTQANISSNVTSSATYNRLYKGTVTSCYLGTDIDMASVGSTERGISLASTGGDESGNTWNFCLNGKTLSNSAGSTNMLTAVKNSIVNIYSDTAGGCIKSNNGTALETDWGVKLKIVDSGIKLEGAIGINLYGNGTCEIPESIDFNTSYYDFSLNGYVNNTSRTKISLTTPITLINNHKYTVSFNGSPSYPAIITENWSTYMSGKNPADYFVAPTGYYIAFYNDEVAVINSSTADFYTLTFNMNGYGTAPDAQKIYTGCKAYKPEAPTAEGYVFEGWYKESACTNAWDFDTDTVTANTTLYAKWRDANVCKIGTTKYTSIAAALAAAHGSETAGNPTTITLIADVTEDVTIASGRYIKLDLNGCVLSGTGTGNVITNSGTLTIDDTNPTATHADSSLTAGGIICGENKVIQSSGAVNILGGYLECTGESYEYHWPIYCTAGTLNISGGTVKTTNDNYVRLEGTSKATVSGGTFDKCYFLVSPMTSDTSELTISGGTFKNANGAFVEIYGNGKANISGGSFIGTATVAASGGETTITGGTHRNIANYGGKITISGGTYALNNYNGIGNNSGTLVIKDAVLSNSDSDGSIIYAAGGTVILENATVKNSNGYGLYVKGADVILGGTTTITGCSEGNLYLANGKTVALGTGTGEGKNGAAVPAWTTPIGVTTQTNPTATAPVAITSTIEQDYSDYFTSDAGYNVCYNDTNQTLELILHVHSWSYAVDSTDSSILTATCGNSDNCHTGDTVETITITAPTLSVYGETGKSESASLSGTTLGGLTVSDTDIKYYAKNADGTYASSALAAAPTAAGSYKASITVDTDKTAYVEYTIAKASQDAPTAGKTDETIRGKADGTLTSVDSTMEYRKSADTEYTAISGTTVEGLSAGEYKVRYAEKDNYAASPDQTLTIADGSTMTLTFDAQGGSEADEISDLSWQETVSVPDSARTGYVLSGWNTKADGTGSELTEETKIEATATYYAIWTPNTYTVIFEANGGSGEMEAQSFTYDEAKNLTANAYTYDDNNFVGWAGTEDAKYAEYMEGASVINLTAEANGSVTLYAVWTEKPVYSISGKVQESNDPANDAVPNAAIELKQGDTVIASTSADSEGNYSFTGITAGEYNIVVTGHIGSEADKTKTSLVSLSDANVEDVYVVLPKGAVSSVVIVMADTPAVVVGGLDAYAEEAFGASTDEIQIKLTVEACEDVTDDETNPNCAAQTAIKEEARGRTVEFISIDVEKDSNSVSEDIHETSTVLEIVIPYETSGKNIITVYRFHDADGDGVLDAGRQIAMTKLSSRPDASYEDGTYYVGKGFIVVYAKYFSMYGIGYSLFTVDDLYTVVVNPAENGTVTADKESACSAETVTLTVTPDKGYTLETLTVIDRNGDEIELTAEAEGESYTFTMPNSMATVTATFMEDNTMLNFFVDVKADDYFYDAVLWAAENGITSGVDETHFAPLNITTRAQMVTFLWRAAGSPEIEIEMPFEDVEPGSYYEKAVAWAIANGITKGTSETTFTPDATVTRGQAVTFLARMSGVLDEAEGYTHSFTDVFASDYYNNAVAWAYSNGITKGVTDDTFAPNEGCLRGQVVTFLYRFFVK